MPMWNPPSGQGEAYERAASRIEGARWSGSQMSRGCGEKVGWFIGGVGLPRRR
jgi:hypothetical protein